MKQLHGTFIKRIIGYTLYIAGIQFAHSLVYLSMKHAAYWTSLIDILFTIMLWAPALFILISIIRKNCRKGLPTELAHIGKRPWIKITAYFLVLCFVFSTCSADYVHTVELFGTQLTLDPSGSQNMIQALLWYLFDSTATFVALAVLPVISYIKIQLERYRESPLNLS